jgi:hypothetical protein
MNWPSFYYFVRCWVLIISLTGIAGIFWGGLIGGVLRIILGIDEEVALRWIFFPICIAFIPYGIFILPKYLKKIGVI